MIIEPEICKKEINQKDLDLKEVLRHSLVLYERQTSEDFRVRLCQELYDGEHRSNFLFIIIENITSKQWLAIRFSAFRKIIKFFGKKAFVNPRRLTFGEKRVLKKEEDTKELVKTKRRLKRLAEERDLRIRQEALSKLTDVEKKILGV